MDNDILTEEIICLQNRLLKLEQEKSDILSKERQEELEYREKNDDLYGLSGLKFVLDEKKRKVEKNMYSRSCIVAKFQDEAIIPALQSIYDAFHLINHRLDKLEDSR